jgi:chorismate dehydratase
VGAVRYLNARPLTFCLAQFASRLEIITDLPSRLADGLAAGELDVALVPSIECVRHSGYSIVSDACVACDGPVRSVKLFSRVPIEQLKTLALDDGSRTSAALIRILLHERFGRQPQFQRLPIGTPIEECTADAVMLIGDRAIVVPDDGFAFVWDLGQQWHQWTGLPFVFAAWIARPGVDLQGIDTMLAAARDEGLTRLPEIARREAPPLGLTDSDCLSYLRDNLSFRLGRRQRKGLELFYELAGRHRLAPSGVELVFYGQMAAR